MTREKTVVLFPHKPEGSEFLGYRDANTGKYGIEPQFQNASRFIEGLASVGFPEDCTVWRDRLQRPIEDRLYPRRQNHKTRGAI